MPRVFVEGFGLSVEKEIVVGDIGGTNGRFAIAAFSEGGHQPALSDFKGFLSSDFQDLNTMLESYLNGLGAARPNEVCLAIAGPTLARKGHLTNLGWTADALRMEEQFGLAHVLLLNDFHALASAAPHLGESDILSIKPGERLKGGSISVMGPGTGFGVSMLVSSDDGHEVVSTEGGHMRFAPVTRLEIDLCESLRRTHEHISIETFLCGRGLQRIHEFIVEYGGSGDASLRPDEITAASEKKSEPSCVRAVQLFLSILGSAAGDIALAHGARGGVFLGGGILPKIATQVENSNFVQRFVSKGPMQSYMEGIPVDLITTDRAALMGAAFAQVQGVRKGAQ